MTVSRRDALGRSVAGSTEGSTRARHDTCALPSLHPDGDHLADVARLFAAFDLDFSRVSPVRGLSTSPGVIDRVRSERFTLVFIDGDHSY